MPERRRNLLICLWLALITLGLYSPATHFDFINHDDPDYILYDPPIQHGLNLASLRWAFTTNHASNWHPLAWISHILDYSFYGPKPGGHHLTNILLHAANTVLLFLVLLQLTGARWRAALVAALFAWHPLHVESVAWVSERKDVLCAFFWLLSVAAYARFAKKLKSQSSNLKFYFLSLFLFALALLSKPMAVTLPFILLLLDFWPLERKPAPRLFLEKIPFLFLSALDGIATIWAQAGAHSVVSLDVLPLSDRLANALVSYILYLWKILWPVDLALPYPYSHFWTFWPAAGAAVLLLLISAAALAQARRQPWLIVGWLWFLVVLFPVIGLAQTGFQSMADRYTYLPLIGVFIMVAWAIPAAWIRWPSPGLVFGAVTAGVFGFLLTAAETQLQYWRNSVALFSHAIAVTGENMMAEYNLAEALYRQGDDEQAAVHYRRAISIKPNRLEARYNPFFEANYNLGLIYRKHKQWPEAAAQFRACLALAPDLDKSHVSLGVCLAALGQTNEALDHFRVAIRLQTGKIDEAGALAKLDAAFAEASRFDQAIAAAQRTRESALAVGRKDLADEAQKRIELYRAAKP